MPKQFDWDYRSAAAERIPTQFAKITRAHVSISFPRDGVTKLAEHQNGILRNNIILNCNDVGIYVRDQKYLVE